MIDMPNADFQLFCFLHNEIFFGLVEQSYNYKEVMQRDMRKPVRREELAISPRLAKILINLSQAKDNQMLLDPFCGVGVILQEALLKRINVIGVDIDKSAIEGAHKNLLWLENNYKTKNSFELFNRNSSQIEVKFDAVASESSLGELLKHKPSRDEAQDIIDNFEIKIIPVLRNLKRYKAKEGKIAITFPFVRESGVDVQRICDETGLKLYNLQGIKFPIREFREDQRVSREFVVLV
jgi:tRNA G10  N-methylase Trm11